MISFDGQDDKTRFQGGDFGGLDDFDEIQQAKILVVGCGGCGNNIAAALQECELPGVSTLAANTDAQHLRRIKADSRVLMGRKTCRGLGAGNQPPLGQAAAHESLDILRSIMEPYDMVMLVTGLGGGTGTGSAPVIAEAARSMGKLTLSICTTPFAHERGLREKNAAKGLDFLTQNSDAIVVIPNERLFLYGNLVMADSQRYVDQVLIDTASTISNIINITGEQNVDFADVSRILRNGGRTLFGVGRASGEGAGVKAAREAAQSPLLDGVAIDRARRILVNCTFNTQSVTMEEWQATLRELEGFEGDDREIIVGQVHSEDKDVFEVAIIASHIEPHPNPVNVQEMEYAFHQDDATAGLHDAVRSDTGPHATIQAPTTDRLRAVRTGFDHVFDAPSEMDGFRADYGTGRQRIQSGTYPAFVRRTAGGSSDSDR